MAQAAFDADNDDSEFDGDEEKMEELIVDIEDECSNVLDSAENSKLLSDIFDIARANYEKDRKGWETFFADLKFELIATDDEDNTKDILSHYLRKAKLELS
jgi:hypothetical protein